jgi:hypothetical protein
MNRRKSGLQGAALFALVAAAGLWGCSGDDVSPGSSDAAGDAATDGDAGSTSSTDGAAAPDATPDSALTSDAPSLTDSPLATDSAADASPGDSASSADMTAADSTTDATGVDGSGSSGTSGGMGGDADASMAPALPQLCTLWDTDFNLNEADASATDAQYDRTQWWGYSITTNFGVVAGSDCAINAMFGNVSDNYENAITTFAIQLMGCSVPTDAGALAYAITNDPGLAGIVFSTTDVNQLSADFMAGVTQTLSCGGPCPPNDGTLPNQMNFPPMPALSADQIGAINAELYFLGQNAPNTAVGSNFSNSSCPPPTDAGTDASPDGG